MQNQFSLQTHTCVRPVTWRLKECYLPSVDRASNDDRLVLRELLHGVEERKVLSRVRINVGGFLEQNCSHEVVEDFSDFAMLLQISRVILLDVFLHFEEVCFEFGVQIVIHIYLVFGS